MRRIGGPRAGDCFEWLGEWRGEGGQPVLVFGDLSPLRLLEVLKMLGGARLVELPPDPVAIDLLRRAGGGTP